MSQEAKKTIVSSWNEWDPLKHVIVGRAEGAMLQAPEPAVYRDFAKDGFPYGKWGPMPEERVAKAVAQLDNFAGAEVDDVPLPTVLKGSLPFVLLMFAAMILLSLFPQIALWLPNRMMG